MALPRTDGSGSTVTRIGYLLLAVAAVAVVIAYPPPWTGVRPLLGVGNFLLPVFVSALALLGALVGGLLAGRGLAVHRTGRLERLGIRLATALGAVGAVGGYLFTVAGFGF